MFFAVKTDVSNMPPATSNSDFICFEHFTWWRPNWRILRHQQSIFIVLYNFIIFLISFYFGWLIVIVLENEKSNSKKLQRLIDWWISVACHCKDRSTKACACDKNSIKCCSFYACMKNKSCNIAKGILAETLKRFLDILLYLIA